MKKILTIAGSDCSGGAGIQADIKTITMHNMYAMSAITALTAQNTTGVYGIMNSSVDFLKNQIDCIFSDIRPDAVKIGMVSEIGIIEAIAEKLKEYKAVNIVADPVMVATSGSRLISEDATQALMTKLLPLADIITPNLAEAEVLTGMSITDRGGMEEAARKLSAKLPSSVGIVIKGGHLDDTADDLLYVNGEMHWIYGKRIDNPNTHGTGCTFSSAIACNLALTDDKVQAVTNAKRYLAGAIEAKLDLGHGSGPLYHNYRLSGKEL